MSHYRVIWVSVYTEGIMLYEHRLLSCYMSISLQWVIIFTYFSSLYCRGAGVCFGPDVAETFMDNNRISMVIRSHECVRTGFCLHYQNDFETAVCAPGTPLVCTIFSASNYCNGDNFGAYITILPHKFSDSQPVGKSGLYYAVHRFKTSSAEIALEVTNRMSLSGLIVRKKNALRMSFQAIDKGNVGQVTC